jgi:putative endonuclease
VAIQTYKSPATYIMASSRNGTLYVGITSNLIARDYHHKAGFTDGFSKKYHCTMLVWFELHETMESAILREKQIKSWKRLRKLALIESTNQHWRDLSETIF